jgi:drug/metabolite transporter (DMT)-like permease
MSTNYFMGVIFAVLCGVVTNGGLLCQKRVINEIPRDARNKRFMRTLMRNPLWVTGFLLEFAGGSVTFMVAQTYIGPALVPGLMATGYIVLVVGSIRILNERLNIKEYMGILLLFFGIFLLGLSALEIDGETVRKALEDPKAVLRIIVFTVAMFVLWGGTHFSALRSSKRKGVIMGFSNGFPFGLSNFWIAPLLALIGIVLRGNGTAVQVVFFVVACIIMILVNLLAIRQTQEAFKFADAHNVIPMQQIPVQIAPILYYFSVFSLDSPSSRSVAYIMIGVILIIISGFFLSRRQSELEQIQ